MSVTVNTGVRFAASSCGRRVSAVGRLRSVPKSEDKNRFSQLTAQIFPWQPVSENDTAEFFDTPRLISVLI